MHSLRSPLGFGVGSYAEPVIHPSVNIHETATVDPGATIGTGTSVWHQAHVRSTAVLGDQCVIGKNVYIDTEVRIGHRCKIQNNVSVYHGVVLMDDVFVGPSATFTNDLVPRAFNTSWTITETLVRSGASVGANATIVCGNTLGEFCMVAAGATVTNDVADHQLVGGTPARHLGWVCRCGTVISREPHQPANLQCDDCRMGGLRVRG